MLALRIAYVSVLLFLVVLGFGGLSATASAQNDVPVVDVLRVDGTVRHKSEMRRGKYANYRLLGIELDEKLEHYA